MGHVFQNRNRFHAIQQLKRYMKSEDPTEQDLYLNACKANAMIYIGDSLKDLADVFKDNRAIEDDLDIPEDD